MDLDEAIRYYSHLADECRRKANIERYDYMDLKDLAAEHGQLADWLNELKVLREKIQKVLEKQDVGRWIPVSERPPEEFGEYRITWKTSRSNKTFIADSEYEPLIEFDNEHGRFNGWLLDDYIKVYPDVEVIAWKPLEEPYTEEES